MFIVNAPFLFAACWSLVSPLLNEVTVKKISILGSSFKKELLEYIEDDNLPDFLGGKAKENWESIDSGPWNSGEVEGYPKPEMEKVVLTLCQFINIYGIN